MAKSVVSRKGQPSHRSSSSWIGIIILLAVASLFVSVSYSAILPSMRQMSVEEGDTRIHEKIVATSSVETHHRADLQIYDSISRVALLMSFPNSGTSFTITNTRRTSQRAVATNYELESKNAEGRSKKIERLLPDLPVSPFLLDTVFEPAEFVLTKTHCSQFCERCVPEFDAKVFGRGCQSISYDIDGEKEWAVYSKQLINRAVHLFRSPFDNLVARMHLGIKRRKDDFKWTEEQLAPFTDDLAGMKAWCRHADSILQGDMAELMRARNVPRKVWENLPCHTDWFRYVMWHNKAIEYLDSLGIPVHILYYEDYTTRYDDAVKDLFEFLHLQQLNQTDKFIPGKTYNYLFEGDTGVVAMKFTKALASEKCWNLIKHYFSPWSEDANSSPPTLENSDSDVDVVSAKQTLSLSFKSPDRLVSHLGSEHHQQSQLSLTDSEGKSQVAWLMSFPNSGTTYTMRNTLQVSGKTVAVNYGKELERRVPVDPDRLDGPFLTNWSIGVPPVVLTKTHCGGYCDSCNMTASIMSAEEFEYACGTGVKKKFEDRVEKNNGGFVPSYYPSSVPVKLVHLIRSPVDNLVSRMHHGFRLRKAKWNWDESEVSVFTNDKDGIHAWCKYVDQEFWKSVPEGLVIDDETMELVKGVPCHSDAFRYVQWHNNAVEMTKRLKKPVHTIYYEDYGRNIDKTVGDLFAFLGLERVNEPLKFDEGKEYQDFFDESELSKLALLIKKIAIPECWDLLKVYFPEMESSTSKATTTQ